jgi:site-specific recombinase XerC
MLNGYSREILDLKASNAAPEITKATVQAFTADLLDAGAEAATARTRHMALRRFAAWLADEGEIDNNPLLGVKPPKLDSKVVDALTDNNSGC